MIIFNQNYGTRFGLVLLHSMKFLSFRFDTSFCTAVGCGQSVSPPQCTIQIHSDFEWCTRNAPRFLVHHKKFTVYLFYPMD